ncbi:MAG: DMT family transporter [bacterium]|nr:MAG: DMT family transporter [bacterium]
MNTRHTDRVTGTLIMIAAVLVLSPDALLISVIQADAWALVFWRGSLTAATLTVSLVVVHGRDTLREGLRMGLPGIVAGTFFACSTLSFVLSVRLTAAANTLVIIAAMPLFAALLTRLFLGEKVPGRTWLAVAAGLGGIAVVFSGSLARGNLVGDLLAMVTAVLMAANFVIIRKNRRVSMIPAVVLGGLLTTTVTFFLTDPMRVSNTDILLLAAMGAVVLPVPLSLMTVAPKMIPAPEVGLIMLLETFLGPLWVWAAIGERLGVETILGGGILVFTLVLHALAGMREQRG